MARPAKFKKLVHLICEMCDDPSKLGATKLNKVLWYVDSFAYRLWGESVSGETAYVKRQFGPVPRRILQTLRDLEEEGAILVRERSYFGKPKREFVALEEADTKMFSKHELEIIRDVVGYICDNHTAASISDLSHDIIWEAAELGEDIPLVAVLAAQAAPVTDDDAKWADGIIEQHRKAAA